MNTPIKPDRPPHKFDGVLEVMCGERINVDVVLDRIKKTLEDRSPTLTPPESRAEYDPDLDITAGELRSLHINVPDNVPDCGWVPRTAMRIVIPDNQISTVEDWKYQVNFNITLTQPFRWIEITAMVEKENK